MAAPPPYPIHSIADGAARIDQGEDPWFALGCFLHDWWCYAVDHRQDLISEPPSPAATQEGRRWHQPQHKKEGAGPRFVLRSLRNFAPGRPSLALYGLSSRTTFSNAPGSTAPSCRSATGSSQQHPRRLNGATSSLAGAFLTTSTNFNTPLTRNPGGPPGRIRNSKTWRERTSYLRRYHEVNNNCKQRGSFGFKKSA